MRDIKALRKRWYWEARDKHDDPTALWCRAHDGQCDYRGGGKHSENCSLVKAMRENYAYKDHGQARDISDDRPHSEAKSKGENNGKSN
jgi:hypothetical protein